MSKILHTYERNIPTVSIMRNANEVNEDPLGTEVRFKQLTQVTQEDIDWCDILEMIRPTDPYSVVLAARARASGCFVMSLFDDDLLVLSEGKATPPWRRSCVKDALALSHMVDTCSPHICEKYRGLTSDQRAFCANSVVNPSEIKFIPEYKDEMAEDKKVRIVYAAHAGHIVFFDHFILPIMPKLCQKYAGKISMTFMGVKPDLAQFEDQIEIHYVDSMPLLEYRQKIQDGNYDIGLAPLIADDFTKCKYFNKFLEYTMAGIVGMYSNVEPYTYVVKHKENGFLVNDRPENWYDSFCEVIDDALLRNSCVRNAQNLLLSQFNVDAQTKQRVEEVPELVHCSAVRTACRPIWFQRLQYRGILVLDRIYQVFFYLSETGVKGLIDRVVTHFRERKALQ